MTGGAVIDDRRTAANALAPTLATLVGSSPRVRIEFWDGSVLGPDDAEHSARITSPDAVRRMLWAPGELGLARAYVCGDLAIDGSVEATLRALQVQAGVERKVTPAILVTTLRAAW